MVNSIFNDTKKALGIHEDEDGFDSDLYIIINSVLDTLTQMGIGESNFYLNNKQVTWGDFYKYDSGLLKNYVIQKTQIIFDPPQTSFAIDAKEKIIRELEWRLSHSREVNNAKRTNALR